MIGTALRERSSTGDPVLVGVVGLALVGLMVLRSLAASDWDPSLYTAFGEDATAVREYAEERLGEVMLRPTAGHDGKFFFVQANDPLVLEPGENAAVLDRPLYRSQRMLYPLLAGGFGLFPPGTILWSMVVVNLVAMGIGAFATASLARDMGISGWWGLAFPLNLGFVSELNIGGAGIVAAAAAFGAVVMVLRERLAWAVALLALSALSREAMMIAAAGVAWWLWRYRKRRAWAIGAVAVPLGAVSLWAGYLRLRISIETGLSQIQEIGLPFVGVVEAAQLWVDDPVDLLAGGVMVVLLFVVTRRILSSSHLVGWAFLGFVGLALVFTRQVWLSYFDISRAIAPLLTAFVLLIFSPADWRGEPGPEAA